VDFEDLRSSSDIAELLGCIPDLSTKVLVRVAGHERSDH